MSRPDHPIFKGPVAVPLVIEQTPTPDHYSNYGFGLELPETLPTAAILSVDPKKAENKLTVGLVTAGSGFLDSPDTERIAGGIHSKGPDYVAIGRQANFLLWGFYGSPDQMTETGRALFLNAVVYASKFAGAPVEAVREVPPRDSLGLGLAFSTRLKGERKLAGLQRCFGEAIPPEVLKEGGDVKGWFEANRRWIRHDGERYVIDEECKALGIANNDVGLLERCISDLEAGKEADRARRILERYTPVKFDEAGGWRKWLEENRSALFFTDWGGYEFRVRKGQDPGNDKVMGSPVEEDPVTLRLSVERRGAEVTGRLAVSVQAGYHLYAPGSKEGIPVSVEVASASGFTVAGDAKFPKARKGHLSGDFEVLLPLKGEGEAVEVLFSFQACTEEYCLPPVKGVRVRCDLQP